jgi:hypothetical protein
VAEDERTRSACSADYGNVQVEGWNSWPPAGNQRPTYCIQRPTYCSKGIGAVPIAIFSFLRDVCVQAC